MTARIPNAPAHYGPRQDTATVGAQHSNERKDERGRDWALEVRHSRPERYEAVNDLLD